MTEPSRIILTIDQANARLPLVRSIVKDIVELYRDVHDRRSRLDGLRRRNDLPVDTSDDAHGEEVRQMQDELVADIEKLESFAEELKELGAELKDCNRGLIDFRTIMDGREVYLCWQHGENAIEWWHELDAGVAGRQALMPEMITDATE